MIQSVPDAGDGSDPLRRRFHDDPGNLDPAAAVSLTDLNRIPALTLLDMLPVPIVAVDIFGSIVHANDAFAQVLAGPKSSFVGIPLEEIALDLPLDGGVAPALQARAGTRVTLTNGRGIQMQAKLGVSFLRRSEDNVVLVTFANNTSD